MSYQIQQSDLLYTYLTGLLSNMVIGFILECVYSIGKYKEMIAYNESLKKQQLQQQFDSLKSQVNPHFLFNTLSSLSALIAEDTDKADAFLNEMSKVYRYMLKANEHGVVALEQELSFIKSYFYLLNVRYNNTIIFEVKTNEKYNTWTISTLSLQMLVDNAIRHNVASNDTPLIIKIETNSEDCITVKNNLQRKKLTMQTAGNSLESLKVKYHSPHFAVRETGDEFVVTIPLQNTNKIQAKVNG
jgi:LytS/YehU family sensor histidine kinase